MTNLERNCDRDKSSIVFAAQIDFKDCGMVPGRGCGTPEMTKRSGYPQKAYQLGKGSHVDAVKNLAETVTVYLKQPTPPVKARWARKTMSAAV